MILWIVYWYLTAAGTTFIVLLITVSSVLVCRGRRFDIISGANANDPSSAAEQRVTLSLFHSSIISLAGSIQVLGTLLVFSVNF